MKQIIVNVDGLSVEEKQRVNEALAKITGFNKMTSNLVIAKWMYAPSSYIDDQITHSDGNKSTASEGSTHTPQQVLEMAGMAKQGHVHAYLMALYAEDAKTTDKPWELWEFKDVDGVWWCNPHHPIWGTGTEYRRKPKTHIVHGVEVPDLRFVPNEDEEYWFPHPSFVHLCAAATCGTYKSHHHRASSNLCYEYTEAGKQAAILHAKAWLGIA